MIVFNMGPEKIEELARECGAYYKADRVVLINYGQKNIVLRRRKVMFLFFMERR